MSTDKDGPEMYPTEVPEKAQRRRFDAEYRLRIVEEADKCTKFGEVGELLRRGVNQRGQASLIFLVTPHHDFHRGFRMTLATR